MTIIIDGGFQPDSIKTSFGRPMRLTFVRKETDGCGVVRFPEVTESRDGENVAVERVLQPGEKTLIVFTPKAKGTFHFTCGDNGYQGVINVK